MVPLAVSEGITLSLHNYRGLVSVDLLSKQVKIKEGTILEELSTISSHWVALATAGAIMTTIHGTAIKYGHLATLVFSLEMVTPGGEVMVVHKVHMGNNLFDEKFSWTF